MLTTPNRWRVSRSSSKSFHPPSGPIASSTRRRCDSRAIASSERWLPGWATRRAASLDSGVELVFDEDPELPMDRHARQPRVAGLLQALDQQRPVGRRLEDVRVEVVALDARGVGEHDPPDAERGELGPQAPQHLRAREGQQQIDAGRRRHRRVELGPQHDPVLVEREDLALSPGAIDDADADDVAGVRAQHAANVRRARAGQGHDAVGVDLARIHTG